MANRTSKKWKYYEPYQRIFLHNFRGETSPHEEPVKTSKLGSAMLHSRWNTSLYHFCFMKTRNFLPHTPLWDSFIKEHLHMSIITKWMESFTHIEISLFNFDGDHHLMSFMSWAYHKIT
jgi:hypothetical protein